MEITKTFKNKGGFIDTGPLIILDISGEFIKSNGQIDNNANTFLALQIKEKDKDCRQTSSLPLHQITGLPTVIKDKVRLKLSNLKKAKDTNLYIAIRYLKL